ncbi:MAG: DUF2939 domain-containing protein [Caulobacteraceae bacterium]
MFRSFFTLLLIVLAGAVIYFAASPWLAFRELRDAAETGDERTLSKLIDYPATRKSISSQIIPAAGEPAPPVDIWRDPVGALKRALEPQAPAAAVDSWLTPKSLSALTNGRMPRAGVQSTEKSPFPMVKYWGVNRCRISVSDPGRPSRETMFTFERRGIYDWKLVRIVLPGKPLPSTE